MKRNELFLKQLALIPKLFYWDKVLLLGVKQDEIYFLNIFSKSKNPSKNINVSKSKRHCVFLDTQYKIKGEMKLSPNADSGENCESLFEYQVLRADYV